MVAVSPAAVPLPLAGTRRRVPPDATVSEAPVAPDAGSISAPAAPIVVRAVTSILALLCRRTVAAPTVESPAKVSTPESACPAPAGDVTAVATAPPMVSGPVTAPLAHVKVPWTGCDDVAVLVSVAPDGSATIEA